MMVLILFGSIQSVSASENDIYEKNGFSIEYPSKWNVKENWNLYLKQVFFQADLRSNSGISIIHQKSIIPISTINDELLQFMIENEKGNCRINKDGPCWDFGFASAKSTVFDNSKVVLLEYQATLDDQETIIKKIFIPEGDENWLITLKVIKDKSELFEEIKKSLATFTRHHETTNESNISNITESNISNIIEPKITEGIPDWVKNTMKWYVEDQISEKEMITILEFLIEQGMIKVDLPQ